MGYCSICGKYGELSFEHIPPKNALNNAVAKVYSGTELVKKVRGQEAKYSIQQKGMGKYSLCEECNNNTGTWYAPTYNLIAKATAWELKQHEPLIHGDIFAFKTRSFHALAFVKQVIAMFCSTIPFEEVTRLNFNNFLLKKEETNVAKDLFDLRIFLTNIETGSYMTGICFPICLDKKSNEITSYYVAELGTYPFGFILNLDPSNPIEYGASLMPLLDAEYGVEYELEWKLQYLEKASIKMPLPMQFKPLPQTED